MSYFGDMQLGSTINFQFTTVGTSGLPTQLAATTATTLSIYPQSITTQITGGATLTTDFDGITGLNAVSVALTAGNGFTTANDYGVVLATGTVGGTNVLGYVVGSFSIENRFVNKIGTSAITNAVFASNAIGATTIAAGALNSATFSAGTIGTATFIAGAISSAVLAPGAIHSTIFTTGAIVATTFAGVLPSNFSSMSISAAGLLAITSTIKKNQVATGFMFVMTDMTTHVPVAGLTVVGTRSLNGAAFGACANTPSNVGSGTYVIDLAATDTNADHIMLRFTNATADDLNIEIITQP